MNASRLPAGLFLAVLAFGCTEAGDPFVERADAVVMTEGLEYETHIRPVFEAGSCYVCHEAAVQGELSIGPLPGMVPSGTNGAVLEPCNGDTSLLYLKLVCSQGMAMVDGVDCTGVVGDIMPTTGALPQDQTDLVKQWIDEGAAATYDPAACP